MNNLLLFAQAGTPPGWAQAMPLVLMVVIFYFLLIRPQLKQKKKQEALVNSLKTGDQVLTTSGIYGTITNVKDQRIVVRIADNVKVEMSRSSVSNVLNQGSEEK